MVGAELRAAHRMLWRYQPSLAPAACSTATSTCRPHPTHSRPRLVRTLSSFSGSRTKLTCRIAYLPGGTAPDPEIERAWRASDVAAFKKRAALLSSRHISQGVTYQYVEMRKGDVVFAHKGQKYALGVLTDSPLDDGAMEWSSFHELGVEMLPAEELNRRNIGFDDVHTRRAFRRVAWLHSGHLSLLSQSTSKHVCPMYQSIASKCCPDKAVSILLIF